MQKTLALFFHLRIMLIITYIFAKCDIAKQSPPVFPGGTRRIHKDFEEPWTLIRSEEKFFGRLQENTKENQSLGRKRIPQFEW